MRVCCVLRSGGDLTSNDVGLLQVCLEKNLPGHKLYCLSDVGVPCERIPLLYGWPKWWSKMELFRPDLTGDIFYMDIDTVVVKDISHMLADPVTTMLSDFYYKWRIASGVMLLTEESRRDVWYQWIKDPYGMMEDHPDGDQKFLQTTKLENAKRFQQRFPGQVISFKRDMRPSEPFQEGPQLMRPPDDARIVCFHGVPRPRQIHYEPWVKEAWS